MKGVIAVLLLACVVAGCHCHRLDLWDLQLSAHNDIKQLLKSMATDVEVQTPKEHKSSNLKSFSFTNCADPNTEVIVPSKVSVSPDPLKLPGNVTVSGAAQIKAKVASPIKVDLQVYKKFLGFWIEVPCLDNVGSCTYDDVCPQLANVTCPAILTKIGLGCTCPFPKGVFDVPSATVSISQSIPVSGGIKVHADVSSGSQVITCVEIEMELA